MKRTVSLILALAALLWAPGLTATAAGTTAENEKYIFSYLTERLSLNSAAACGILANIAAESSFNPTSEYYGAYGICQWTGGRRTQLKNYCSNNGLDWRTLEGQLRYLAYELTLKEYSRILSYMKDVDNSADGAYDAGYYWCRYFERPANSAKVSVLRGNAAKGDYWPKYSAEPVPESEPEDDDAARVTHISISETTAWVSVTAKEEGLSLMLCSYGEDGALISAQLCPVPMGRGVYELEVPEGTAKCVGLFLSSEGLEKAASRKSWAWFFLNLALN